MSYFFMTRKIIYALVISTGFILANCAPSTPPPKQTQQTQVQVEQVQVERAQVEQPPDIKATDFTSKTAPSPTPIGQRFQSRLDRFIALNARLDVIAARLKFANADLCPQTHADIGFSVHTLADYPLDIRPAAQHFLNVGPDISVRTVRRGSPADKAGIKAGDMLLSVNAQNLIDGALFKESAHAGQIAKAIFQTELNAALSKVKDAKDAQAVLEYKREAQTHKLTLPIQQHCSLPVTLFFSDNINGHYMNGEIWIASGLLHAVPDDAHVAYIAAHEMAHALRDNTKNRTVASELEADRIGLILLARAGYDTAHLSGFWDQQKHLLHGEPIRSSAHIGTGSPAHIGSGSSTHPDWQKRAENFNHVLSQIKAAQRQDHQRQDHELKALIQAPK